MTGHLTGKPSSEVTGTLLWATKRGLGNSAKPSRQMYFEFSGESLGNVELDQLLSFGAEITIVILPDDAHSIAQLH